MIYTNYCCGNCPYKQYNESEFLMRTASPDNPITVTAKEVKYNDTKIKENLRVPILKGPIPPKILSSINGNLENDIMEFKQQMEAAAEENAQTAKQANKPVVPYNISNIYAITYNKNNIISISLVYEQVINGKRYYIRTTYNYNTSTGKSLSVRDLFKPGVDAKSLINTEIFREIRSNPQDYFPGTVKNFKGIADDQPFYIDNGNLVLFFSFNEIAPVASQIPVIKIPITRFKDSINPQLLRGQY